MEERRRRATTRMRVVSGTGLGSPLVAGTGNDDELMVRARGLRKSFGDFEAVKGIDVDVTRGEAFGFLGPNGAGKSSTMRMIAAVSPVSRGELRILGMDPAEHGPAIRARLGVCPQEDTLDTELSVCDNLFVYGRYFGIPRRRGARAGSTSCWSSCSSPRRRKAKVEDLSGGMKRRLTIARSLINQPDLLLLDEPTTGLDPQARHVLWDRLFRLKQQGVTLVLTTHYMDEAEQLCDRLVVMDKGVIVAEGSPPRADPRALDARGGRAAVRGRRARGVRREGRADLAERVEVLPDRLLLYSARRRGGDRQGPRARARRRRRPWCAGRRWRTCSSGSPAGPWWTDGRRPSSSSWRRSPAPASSTTGRPSTSAPGRARSSRPS